MTVRMKIFCITVCIIIAAVAIVLFVSYFTGKQPGEYDGTLVNAREEILKYL